MRCYSQVLLMAFCTLVAVNTLANTYKYTDKDGNVVYSSKPPQDGTKYEKVRTNSSYGGTTTEEGTEATPATTAGGDNKNTGTVKKEMEKNLALRQQNCEGAKKNLEAYTVFRRILDKDGNVVILDDNERAKRIEEAKKAIEEFCD